MSELIKEAIKEINHSYATIVDGELVYQRSAMLNMFRKGAEWQSGQSPWISVKERLPDESEFVLCRMVSNEAIVGGYIFVSPDGLPCVATLPNFEFDDYGGYVCDMWMPIPKFN
jgi:hypothetical protein